MTDLELAELVLNDKTPSVSVLGEKATLIVGVEEHEITMEQADLLFSTMFFRGKI